MLLNSLGKASLGCLGKLHGVSQTTAYYLVRWEAERLSDSAIPQDIQEIEFDEMSQFLQPKPTTGGLARHCIVVDGEPLPGRLAIVMLQPSVVLQGSPTPIHLPVLYRCPGEFCQDAPARTTGNREISGGKH